MAEGTRCTWVVHVALLSSTVLSSSPTSAYTPNAQTNRYLKEMGRLLRDPQLQAYAPAQTSESPSKPAQDDTFIKDYPPPPPTTVEYYQPETPGSEPYGRHSAGSDLLDALNQQIEALDQQINSARTRRDDIVADNTTPLPPPGQAELDYDYNSYIDSSDANVNGQSLSQMNNGQESYEDSHFRRTYDDGDTRDYYYSSPSEQNSHQEGQEYYETMEHYQPSEQVIYDETDQYHAKESYETTSTEYSEMEAEYQYDEYHYQQTSEAPVYEHQPPKSMKIEEEFAIQKRKGIPQLPITNDPFQLLGLDYDNPPKTEKDIKRAFLKMAKKYHPDTISSDATSEERDAASVEFSRINAAYQAVKEMLKQFEADRMFHDDLITYGGPMYDDRRTSHIRRPFSRVNGDFDNRDSSYFSEAGSSAKHSRSREDLEQSRSFWGRRKSNRSQYGESRTPFRYRQDVGDSCHVGVSFPPFSGF